MTAFHSFFRQAMGNEHAVAPYPYQVEYATRTTLPRWIRVPTSAGKTATAIIGWLYQRVSKPDEAPRRLVYCLPMRVLVEQTERDARRWIANLGLDVPVHVLMGGAIENRWCLSPEKSCLLIGTQDMLLSRALNRGYAASRFHWPIEFGLLNNDALWIFDEPQLMGSGVSTSAQLAGLRQAFGTFGHSPSVWMSATFEPAWLNTIDFRQGPADSSSLLALSDADLEPGRPLFERMAATKRLFDTRIGSTRDMKDVARAIWGESGRQGVHLQDTQTLVIVNTVERAKSLFAELVKLRKKATEPRLLLVHSRYRPIERRALNAQLELAPGNRIVIATQVVEAGVDISARTLVTELAPWPSLVQRMGRCNRTGRDGPGAVYWLDVDEEKNGAPYDPSELTAARGYLRRLEGQSVSPLDLERFRIENGIELAFDHRHVLRRRDLLDLFDTAPDLSGNDIDIQRFVRGDDPETDVQVCWRHWESGTPTSDEPLPLRDELCNVPIRELREFLDVRGDGKRVVGYSWDHLDEQWTRVDSRQLRPGMIVLLPAEAGGYDWDERVESGRGWDSASDRTVAGPAVGSDAPSAEGAGGDPNSTFDGPALTIAQHTSNVCRELSELLDQLGFLGVGDEVDWRSSLMVAARWHDVGKAHWAFQQGMRSVNPSLSSDQLWAKSGKRARLQHGRPLFRHELASALAALQRGEPFLIAYLAASHHGRIRLAIRALPGERGPRLSHTLFALGIHDGDPLPSVELNGDTTPDIKLDLSPMRLGGEQSWTARALMLLSDWGPFRLAYLESLLRVADARASHKEAGHG